VQFREKARLRKEAGFFIENYCRLTALYCRMKYDVRLKAIFQDAMPGLLRVLQLPGVKEYLTVEFPKRNKSLPDLVLRLIDGWIVHIELQSKNDLKIV